MNTLVTKTADFNFVAQQGYVLEEGLVIAAIRIVLDAVLTTVNYSS